MKDLFTGSIGEVAGWSAAAIALFKYWIDRQKLKSKDLYYIVELQAKEIAENKDERDALKKEIQLISQRLNVIQEATFQLSIPQWIKDKKGRLVFGNQAYVDNFLTPSGLKYVDALDKTDLELWANSDLAKMYRDNDRQVMRSGVGNYFTGSFIASDTLVETYYKAHIDPYFISGKVAGVIGVAVPLDSPQNQ